MCQNIDYSLYLCTDRALMSTETIEESVALAIAGGCTVVQLREKDLSSRDFYHLALRVKAVTDSTHTPLIINDRVDIALAVDADGVHVGQSDLPAHVVRQIIGPHKLLGVSASNLEEATGAAADGADYLGVGAMFATATKTDAALVSLSTLEKIRRAVKIPIVVIGGIKRDTIPYIKGMGVDGIAVISAILSQEDITGAARELLTMFQG